MYVVKIRVAIWAYINKHKCCKMALLDHHQQQLDNNNDENNNYDYIINKNENDDH